MDVEFRLFQNLVFFLILVFLFGLQFEVNRGLNIGRVTAEKGFTADSQLIPKLTFRFPSKPKVLRRLVNKLNKFWKKAFKFRK